jgi:hypothetical protein
VTASHCRLRDPEVGEPVALDLELVLVCEMEQADEAERDGHILHDIVGHGARQLRDDLGKALGRRNDTRVGVVLGPRRRALGARGGHRIRQRVPQRVLEHLDVHLLGNLGVRDVDLQGRRRGVECEVGMREKKI